MVRIFSLILLLVVLFTLPCKLQAIEENIILKFPFITRKPKPAQDELRKLEALPSQNLENNSAWQVDVHSADLSELNLLNRTEDLFYADFDSRTVWPKLLPNTFDPQVIMAFGKNPGLGLRNLHQKGITGRNVGIGIIDAWALLVDHVEYCDRLRFYEEIPPNNKQAMTHFSAVVSIAAGKNVGVAPEADLYVIGISPHFKQNNSMGVQQRPYMTNLACAIDRLVEINKSLPKDRCIRVIACPMGWPEVNEYNEMILPAVERAKKEGIFVVSCSVDDTYKKEKLSFNNTIGMGREPLADPDLLSSYGPCYYSEKDFIKNGLPTLQQLLLPMDSRCMASATSPKDYIFVRHGGSSWVVPYIAGLYALCCQVKPEITPIEFWKAAMKTGDCIDVDLQGIKRSFGTIINPEKLFHYLTCKEK